MTFADAAAQLERDVKTLTMDVDEIGDDLVTLEKRVALLEARLTALEPPPSPPAPEPPGWELAWSDEFDGAVLDLTKWTPGENSWGTTVNASEHQAWVAGNAHVTDSILRLVAERRPWLGKQFVSGIVHTKGKAEWLPPLKVEIRAKYPVGNGFWPGLWLLHDEQRKAGTFEIDILEVMGNKPDSTYSTYHYYPNDFDHKEIDCWVKQAAGFGGQWHTYTLTWMPTSITWEIDGRPVQTIASDRDAAIVTVPPVGPRTTATGKPLICDRPMHLIMDLSLGGWDGNAPDATTPLPASFDIEYVRVSRWRE